MHLPVRAGYAQYCCNFTVPLNKARVPCAGSRWLGEGKLLMSDSFPGQERSKLCLAQKVPLGVVLCIPPFNYPCALPAPCTTPC